MRVRATIAALVSTGIAIAVACTDVPTEPDEVLALAFDSLPSPSVVIGDSLRDTSGVAIPLSATAYNFQGEVIPGASVTFSSPDRGVRVAASGFVTGDSLRATPARIVATIGALQATLMLDVTLRPDTVAASNGRDSLGYSLVDTTRNVSPELSVSVRHGLATADSAVKSYIVSFSISSPVTAGLVALVNDAGRPSRIDTTDASGIAGRKIRLDASRLTALSDSVIVQATVKHRGAAVRGSPVRLVLKLKPASL